MSEVEIITHTMACQLAREWRLTYNGLVTVLQRDGIRVVEDSEGVTSGD